MVNRIIIAIGIALSSFNAMGAEDGLQPGYVVISGQDTVRGFVVIRDNAFNSRTCSFRKTVDGAETTYSPGDIVAYGTVDKYFRSFVDSSDPSDIRKFFVECLVYGRVSLFFREDDFFIERDNAILALVEVKKEVIRDGKTFLLKQPLYRSTLQAAMGDCKEIYKEVASANLDRKSLVGLFTKYHDCIGARHKLLSVNSHATAVRIGLGVSVIQSQLIWSQTTNPDYFVIGGLPAATNVSVVPVFWLELWRPSFMNKLRLRSGLNFYFDTFRQTHVSTTSGRTYDFTFKNSRIEVPIQLRYSFSGKGLYAIAGIGLSRSIVFEDELIIKATASNTVLTTATSLDPALFTLQGTGGLGFEWPIGDRSYFVQADVRVTTVGVTKGANYGQPVINIAMIALTAGIPLSKDR